MMQFIYGSKLSDNIFLDDRGQLICKNVKVARDGYQDYLGDEIGLDGDYNIYPVYRPTEEVFKNEVKGSFENSPVTDGHPKEAVTIDNMSMYSKGFARDIRKETENETNYLLADLVITDKVLIDKILNQNLREISCGYSCQIEEIDGQYTQTNIIGNHIAVVDKGRAETTKIIDSKGGNQMFGKKKTEEKVVETTDTKPEEETEEVETTVEEETEETVNTQTNDGKAVPVLDSELIEFLNNNRDKVMDLFAEKDEKEEEESEEKPKEKEEVGDSALEAFSGKPFFECKSVIDSRAEYAERQKKIMEMNNQGGNE